jgi:GNAT superfamily N-acetyltransferase
VRDLGQHARLFGDGYVHPDYRGRGIGTALARWSEGRARELVDAAPRWINITNMCRRLYYSRTTWDRRPPFLSAAFPRGRYCLWEDLAGGGLSALGYRFSKSGRTRDADAGFGVSGFGHVCLLRRRVNCGVSRPVGFP